MRRLMAVLALAAVAGCSDFRNLVKAHADEAATAGALRLTPDRLAEILTGPKGIRLSSDAAEYVTGLWLDYALFAGAVAEHKLPADSQAVADALWPEVANIRASRWFDSVVARNLSLTDAGLDSVFTSGPLRVFQHILFPVSQTATPEERAVAHKQAEAALDQIKAGANFGGLASRLSKDQASAQDSGYLPPARKGQFMVSFDSAGWTLAPGQVSGIVQTPYGYHIIRRPTLADARSRFEEAARQVVRARVDSVYFDSLAQVKQLKVGGNIAPRIREAIDDIEGSRGSKDRLISWKGGELTVGGLLRWVAQLPPPYRVQVTQMPDTSLARWARIVAQNEMALQDAKDAGVGPTPIEWGQLEQQYKAQVDSLKSEMGLGSDVSDTSVTLAHRNEIAALRLKTYFDQIIQGKVRARPLPASLGDVLRDRLEHHIYQAGVQRGLELAQRQKAQEAADSTSEPQVAPSSGMQPAPGPAPAPADSK
jgi:hypothetical protein